MQGAKNEFPHVFWLDTADASSGREGRSMLTLSLTPVATIDAQGVLTFDRACDDLVPHHAVWQRLDAAVDLFRKREPGCPAGWVSWHGYACGFLDREDLREVSHPEAIPMAEVFEVDAALISSGSETHLVVRAADEVALERLVRHWQDRLAFAFEGGGDAQFAPPEPLTILQAGSKTAYLSAIEEIQDHISSGQVQQVCLTYPISFERPASMAQWYAVLRERSPAGYCAFVQTPSMACASTSPESLFEIEGRTIRTRPMKGTRRRGTLPDAQLEEELRTHPKDRAENEMIAQLALQDLQQVCVPGTAYVRDAFTVETYATVLQLTSTIEGELQEGVGPFGAFAALTPPASMTGAPRAEACAILSRLEHEPRGVYSGSIAWIDGAERSQFSVVIRALQSWKAHTAWHVGGGIIAASDAEDEWLESRAKAVALGLEDEA